MKSALLTLLIWLIRSATLAVVSIPASLVFTFLGYLLTLLLTFGGFRINYSFIGVFLWVFIAIHLLVTFYDNRTTYIAARRVRRPFRDTVPAIHYFFLDHVAPADDLPRLVRPPFFLNFALEVARLFAGVALRDFLRDFSRWYSDIWLTAEGAYMKRTLDLPIPVIVKAVKDYKAAGLEGDGYFNYGAFNRWVRDVWLPGKQGRSHAEGELNTADLEEIRILLQVTPSANQNTDYAVKANTQAKRAANEGRHLEAIRGYTAVIASTLKAFPPAAGEAYYNRGNSLDEIGLYEEAVEDFTQALAILDQSGFSDPVLLSKIHNNRGISLDNLSRRDEAISAYSAAITANPKWSSPYYNRGLAFEMQGNLIRACEDYKAAASLGNREASKSLRRLGF